MLNNPVRGRKRQSSHYFTHPWQFCGVFVPHSYRNGSRCDQSTHFKLYFQRMPVTPYSYPRASRTTRKKA